MSIRLAFLFASLLALALVRPPDAAAQGTPIHEARTTAFGQQVTIEGTVTRAFGSYVRLQDDSGPTGVSGLVLRQTEGDLSDEIQHAIAEGTIRPGTVLRLTGTTSAFRDLVQINNDDLASYTVVAQGDPPAPVAVSLAQIASTAADENYESVLVRVPALSIVDPDEGAFQNQASYTVQDAAGTTLTLRVQQPNETALGGTAIPSGTFDYEGVVGIFEGAYQLIPVQRADLDFPYISFNRAYAIALEGDTNIAVQLRAVGLADGERATVTVDATGGRATLGTDATGYTAPTTYTFTGPTPSPQTITLDAASDTDPEGIERLELSLSTSDAPSLLAPSTFTLWILDDATAQTTLYPDLAGEALVEQLRADFAPPSTLGYDVARDTLYGTVFNENGTVEAFYTGFAASLASDPDPSQAVGDDGVNTEHLWPQSLGAGEEPARSNMHILVPARGEVNTARSNFPFADIPDDQTTRWYGADQTVSTPPTTNRDAYSEFDGVNNRFEPREIVKGDVARALFYFYLTYPGRAEPAFFSTQEETLRGWHAHDPVDAAEQQRNVRIASYQDNTLNPFQLDPTLIDRVDFGLDAAERTIAEARSAPLGTLVTIEGTVTRAFGSYVRLQDDSGPTGASAIVIRQTFGSTSPAFQQAIADGTIRPGTVLRLTGATSAFNGLLQINNSDLASYTVVAQGDPPAPQTVTLTDLATNGADYESELVTIDGLTFVDPGASTFRNETSYTVQDADGTTLTFRVQNDDETALGNTSIPVLPFDYEGVVGVFSGDYQLIPIRPSDLTVRAMPPETFPVDVTVPFAEPIDADSYRLVALPGAINRSISSTLDGQPGTDWQAFWDDGTPSDYLVPFDGSPPFNLGPGRGLWLASRSDWRVALDVPSVPLTNGATTIPLRDGWNIISNPLDIDVDWSAVETANGGALQPLWAWTGTGYREAGTFASARTGEAFYFFNADDLDALTLPYTPATAAPVAARTAARTVQLTAVTTDGLRTTVHLGTASGAVTGRDAHDVVAPPAAFSTTTLIALPPEPSDTERQARLARDMRPTRTENHTFNLMLQAEPGQPITLRLDGAAFAGANVVLVDLATGTPYDLRAAPSVELRPTHEQTALRVLVGDDAFVTAEQERLRPDALRLHPNYPNPFRSATTLTYDLPRTTTVRVAVYDVLGRRVHVLVDGEQPAGRHTVRWEGRRTSGHPLASGVYFVRLEAGDQQRTQRLMLVR